MESNQIESAATAAPVAASASVVLKPQDRRCRYWAIVVRADASLPLPSSVSGASDIGIKYSRVGDEELLAGDVVIEGEENHHRNNRGWSYWVTFVGSNGEAVTVSPSAAIKASLKAQGMAPTLLTGSGEIAACVRIAHALRAGLTVAAA